MSTTNSRFPINLSIQTTSICNGRCVFCPNKSDAIRLPPAVMEQSVFAKIIDECSAYKEIERIILYLNNEPLTDPDILNRIRYAKSRLPWASVHLVSNGSLLSEELQDGIIDSSLDWIGFSMHGLRKETFEKAMCLPFEQTIGRVTGFIAKAGKKRNLSDFVMITFLRHQYLSEEEKDEAMRFWRGQGITRISYFDGPVSRAGNVEGLPRVSHDSIAGCSSIWADDMIHIVENGDVIMCCMDWKREMVLGNVRNRTIIDVWNSKEYEAARRKRDGLECAGKNFICMRCEAAVPGAVDRGDTLKPDVFLVIVPPWGVDAPPLGLAYVSAYCRSQGLRTGVFDFNAYLYNRVSGNYKDWWKMGNASLWRSKSSFDSFAREYTEALEQCVEAIISSGAPVAGFSVLSNSQDRMTLEIIRRLKERVSSLKVIIGGISVSIPEQRCLFESEGKGLIDAFIIGEGEESAVELIRAYKKGGSVQDIPGVLIPGNSNHSSRGLKENIDEFPFPTFEEFDLSLYTSGNPGNLLMEWSRGCVGACSFCAFKSVSPRYRGHSPGYVSRALAYYSRRYAVSHCSLVDSAVNGDPARLKDICRALASSGNTIQFSALAIPNDSMDQEMLLCMKGAGFIRLEYGIESGSDEALRLMNKCFTSRSSSRALELTHNAGITTVIYLLVGFPGENERNFDETKNFIGRNAAYIDLVKSVNPLYLMAGSPVYKNRERYSIVLPEDEPAIHWSIKDENTFEIRLARVREMRSVLDEYKIRYYTEDNQFERVTSEAPDTSGSVCTDEYDIALVLCPVWGVNMPPLGISYLYAYLKEKGYTAKVIDINIELFKECSYRDEEFWNMRNYRLWSDRGKFEDTILPRLDRYLESYACKISGLNTGVVGFSVNAGNLLCTIELARRVKEKSPEKKIIFGGPHARWFKYDIQNLEQYKDVYRGFYAGLVDYFVIGDGEHVLSVLLDEIKKNKNPDVLPGVIAFRSGRHISLGEEEYIPDLDSLPFPDFSWADIEGYSDRKLPVLMSRGCIRKCVYCNDRLLYPYYRRRSAKNVFEELKFRYKQTGINNFEFFDLILNGDLKDLEKLCDMIIRENLDIVWAGQAGIRGEMSLALLIKMKKAGCGTITYGIESFSDPVLRFMNKPYTYADIVKVLKESAAAEISVKINIITGFPGESEEMFRETLERIRECRQFIEGVSSLAPCLITLGSELQKNLDAFGITYPGVNGYFTWFSRDGNNYEMRKIRAQRVFSLCEELVLSVSVVNLYDDENPVVPQKGGPEKTDVLLVTMPPWGVHNPPIGLGFLTQYLRDKGISAAAYDCNIDFYNASVLSDKMLWHVENKNFWSNESTFQIIRELFESAIERAVNRIIETNARIVGFSVVDPKERLTAEVITRVKRRSPQTVIVLGGPACSTPEQRDFIFSLVPSDAVDYWVAGEGEETLHEIAVKEKNAHVPEMIPGAARRVNGTWNYTPRKPNDLLDSIPFPRYETFELNAYVSKKSFLMQWSRGCLGRCSFCKNYRLEQPYRSRGAGHICREIEYLVKNMGMSEFTVCDNLMNGDISQLSLVAGHMAKRGLPVIWSGQIAPRREMPAELFKVMAKAGCRKIQIGIESGSRKVLKSMRKIYTSDMGQDALRMAKKAGMETEIFVIVGFPGEGESDFKATSEFIRKNAGYVDTIKSINTLHLIAGTDIYEQLALYGIKPLPSKDWHYLWETTDGNTYAVRKERTERLLGLARGLGIKVMETNILEGKEQSSEPVSLNGEALTITGLREKINSIARLPDVRIRLPGKKLRRRPVRAAALVSLMYAAALAYITYFWLFRMLKKRHLLGGE
ncbi:MAG: radical SAM protein [Candidatus Omnitrophica bacterium]|nr:radical SAM protein [Candidatus Omnitrophota bacterium]